MDTGNTSQSTNSSETSYPTSSHINNQRGSLPLILAGVVLLLVVGGGAYYVGSQRNNSISTTQDAQVVPTTTLTQDTPEQTQNTNTQTKGTWTKTSFVGMGLAFEYPNGWHVASYEPDYLPNFAQQLLINDAPIMVSTPHGPASKFIITLRNGSNTPEDEFKKELDKQKAGLIKVEEKTFPSEYFGTIYQLKGEFGEGMLGGTKIEKYFFMSTNAKYANLGDKLNLNIVTAEVMSPSSQDSELLQKIVLSFRECHYTTCESVLK